MLKRKYRLDRRTRLKFTKSFTTPFFLLRILRNNLLYNRYGFIVSKRIDKRAVVRNRTKRMIRACVEEMLESVSAGYDMLFVAKEKIRNARKEDVCFTIKSILARV